MRKYKSKSWRNIYFNTFLFVVGTWLLNFTCTGKAPEYSVTYRYTTEKLSKLSMPYSDTTILVLWRKRKYDEEVKDTISELVINSNYCKKMPVAAKAALAYVATFIGNDCQWDGDAKDDMSNLKCSIISALDLGYQCSEKHLSFLRQWFRDDAKAMKELQDCPIMPFTATVQTTFDKIRLTIKGDSILVRFQASGVNMREEKVWSWAETDYFKVEGNKIRLAKTSKSKMKKE